MSYECGARTIATSLIIIVMLLAFAQFPASASAWAPSVEDGELICDVDNAKTPIDRLKITTSMSGIAEFSSLYEAHGTSQNDNTSSTSGFTRGFVAQGYHSYQSDSDMSAVLGAKSITSKQLYESLTPTTSFVFSEDMAGNYYATKPFVGANTLGMSYAHDEMMFGVGATASKGTLSQTNSATTPMKLALDVQTAGSTQDAGLLANGWSSIRTSTTYTDVNRTVSERQHNVVGGYHNLTASFVADSQHTTNTSAKINLSEYGFRL